MGVCCWGIPIVEFWSLLAPCHTPPHCFKADSNFVGFVIKQHWRLWFLMPSLESMSEVKGHFPCGKAFTFFWNWTKMRKASQFCDFAQFTMYIQGMREKSSLQVERGQVSLSNGFKLKSSDSSPRLCPAAAKPASHGWGGPVCHLLRWLCSGCAAVRLSM